MSAAEAIDCDSSIFFVPAAKAEYTIFENVLIVFYVAKFYAGVD